MRGVQLSDAEIDAFERYFLQNTELPGAGR
jgi:hypothetical protein